MTREDIVRSHFNPSDPRWSVTVLVEGNNPETHEVNAPREGLAKTHAMMLYTQPLAGKEVSYEVTKLS